MEIIKKTINQSIEKLEKLVLQYPTKIPLRAVAEFLEMNEEGLKAALMRRNAPFGFGYQKDDGGYRVFVIPTLTFCLWYTNCDAQMVLANSQTSVKVEEK